jgi:hypothetical protein
LNSLVYFFLVSDIALPYPFKILLNHMSTRSG